MLLPFSLLKVVTLWMRSHITNEVLKVAVGALVGRLLQVGWLLCVCVCGKKPGGLSKALIQNKQ